MEKIHVEKDKCIGCGSCVAIAPDNFEFDEDGLAEVKKQETNEDVKSAADCCPTQAITVNQ